MKYFARINKLNNDEFIDPENKNTIATHLKVKQTNHKIGSQIYKKSVTGSISTDKLTDQKTQNYRRMMVGLGLWTGVFGKIYVRYE